MIKRFSFLCLASILLLGCVDAGKHKMRIEDAPLRVEIVPESDTLDLSDCFRTCELLELKGFLPGEIVEALPIEEGILVQSKVRGTDLHLFDKQGNYLRSLVRYGRAKDEVLNVQTFCYNEYQHTADVLCNYGKEIRQYPLDGTPCATIPLPEDTIFSAKDVELLDRTTYVLYKDIGYLDAPEYKLYLYDYKRGAVVDAFLPLNREIEEKIAFSQKNNLYRKDGKVYFYEVFQNGIFEVDGKGIAPSLAFAKNAYTFPSDLLSTSRDTRDLIDRCKTHRYIWAHVDCMPYREGIFSVFNCSSNRYLNRIDLKRKEARSYMYVNDDLYSRSILPVEAWNLVGSTDESLICTFRYNERIPENLSYLLFLQGE